MMSEMYYKTTRAHLIDIGYEYVDELPYSALGETIVECSALRAIAHNPCKCPELVCKKVTDGERNLFVAANFKSPL